MAETLPDPDTLRRLLERLAGTDVDELEVEVGTTRVYLRREPDAAVLQVVGGAQGVTDHGERSGIPITAPLTGVYYSRPSPDQSPYVSIGRHVAPGDVVALIETMKMFNEVLSDVAGEVSAIVVEDNQLVEAGQPIMYVRRGDEKVSV